MPVMISVPELKPSQMRFAELLLLPFQTALVIAPLWLVYWMYARFSLSDVSILYDAAVWFSAALAVLVIVVIVNSFNGPNVPAGTANPADTVTWLAYTNKQFGTTAEYPNWFANDQSMSNGSTFKSSDGATIDISWSQNTNNVTAADILKTLPGQPDMADVTITKQDQGDRWIEVQGTGKNQTFYYEVDVLSRQGKILNTMIVRCPASAGALYNNVVTHMWAVFIDRNP